MSVLTSGNRDAFDFIILLCLPENCTDSESVPTLEEHQKVNSAFFSGCVSAGWLNPLNRLSNIVSTKLGTFSESPRKFLSVSADGSLRRAKTKNYNPWISNPLAVCALLLFLQCTSRKIGAHFDHYRAKYGSSNDEMRFVYNDGIILFLSRLMIGLAVSHAVVLFRYWIFKDYNL